MTRTDMTMLKSMPSPITDERDAALDREAERNLREYNENRRRLRYWVRRCRDLTGREQTVIQEIIDLCNAGDRFCWASYRWLGRELGIGFCTISAAIRKAESLGVLRVHQVATPTGKGNTYHLKFDVLGDAEMGSNVVRMQAPGTAGKRYRNSSKGATETVAKTKGKLNRKLEREDVYMENRKERQPDREVPREAAPDGEREPPPARKVLTDAEVTLRVNDLIAECFPYLGEDYDEALLNNWVEIGRAVTDAVRAGAKDAEILEHVVRPLVTRLRTERAA